MGLKEALLVFLWGVYTHLFWHTVTSGQANLAVFFLSAKSDYQRQVGLSMHPTSTNPTLKLPFNSEKTITCHLIQLK